VDDARARFTVLDDLTDALFDAADAEADPVVITFLLRRYLSGREDLTEVLGAALARGVDRSRSASDAGERVRWLEAFVTAAPLSSDPRMQGAIEDLVAALRAEWGSAGRVADRLASVDACLQATRAFETPGLVSAAIDELERVVGASYRPGYGVASAIGDVQGPRGLPDQIAGAAALITACVGTSRLPYGMLAEELVQFALRTFWSAGDGAFDGGGPDALVVNCDAVRVLCRLARLLEDEDYRRGAVIAADADYRREASRILESQLDAARGGAARAAPYALALDDWLALR